LAAALMLSGCSGESFALSADQLAAAEQKSFDAILNADPDADVLFIAHQWQDGRCRRDIIGRASCQVKARISEHTAWIPVTARLRRQKDGSWLFLGANWPKR
jgi:hypothetical protein